MKKKKTSRVPTNDCYGQDLMMDGKIREQKVEKKPQYLHSFKVYPPRCLLIKKGDNRKFTLEKLSKHHFYQAIRVISPVTRYIDIV